MPCMRCELNVELEYAIALDLREMQPVSEMHLPFNLLNARANLLNVC